MMTFSVMRLLGRRLFDRDRRLGGLRESDLEAAIAAIQAAPPLLQMPIATPEAYPVDEES
jgi:hypothetical protein